MSERLPARFRFNNGYVPTTALVFGIPDCIIAGTNLWNQGRGLLKTAKGFGASVANSGGVNPLLNVAATYGGLTGGGSIVQAFGAGIYFFAGSGSARVGGVSLGSVLGGTVTIFTGSSTVQAGLLPPGAAVIADLGSAGHNNGSYSIALTAIRSLTGAESSIGPPSNVLSVKNHGIKITSLPAFPSGANKMGIYVTKRGFGSIGPYFHLYDVAIPGTPYTIQVPNDITAGWIDAQLGDLAPLDFGLPPPCTFCFAINSVIVAAGCYGGAGLSPSYPNKPEAYPVSFVLFVPGGGTITMIKGSGFEGAVMVGTASSLNLVTASQSTISPLNIRPIWPTTGVASANQITSAGGELFAWIGRPIRGSISSESDPGAEASTFAAPVMKFFEANAYGGNTVVVYDGPRDCVWFINGTVGISFNRWNGQWNTPMTMPASIVTGVSDTANNNRALLSDSAGNLYTPETGSGTSWTLVCQFQGGTFASFPKTLIGAKALANVACTMDAYKNLNSASIVQSDAQAANQGGPFVRYNLQDVDSFSMGLHGSDAGGKELYGIELLEIEHPVRI